MTTQEKQIELDKIAKEVRDFKGLDIARNATHAVPGEGNPDSQIMFIGEGPGQNEDLQGRPFVGQAGKLLEKTLFGVLGLQRSEVYITNIVKYRPPNNRDPMPDEIEACRDWLDRQIAVIQPNIIATLGRFSMAKFIPDVTISRVHGIPRFFDFSYTLLLSKTSTLRIIIFPMYHPAAALRAGSMMDEFIADFNKLKGFMDQNNRPALVSEQSVSKPAQTSLF